MCAGDGFSGSFDSCSFEKAPLYVVHGASASIRRCSFRNAHHQPGLCVSGQDAFAAIEKSIFSNCCTSVVATEGGGLCATDCVFTATLSGVIVNSSGSCASLQRCSMRGNFPLATSPRAKNYGINGVFVSSGDVTLRWCALHSFMKGVNAVGVGGIEMHRVLMDELGDGVTGQYGAIVHARDALFRCPVPVEGESCAFQAQPSEGGPCRVLMQLEHCSTDLAATVMSFTSGPRTVLCASFCSFLSSHGDVLVGMVAGGEAVLLHCTGAARRREVDTCLAVTRKGQLKLVGGCYYGHKRACTVIEAGAFNATGCDFHTFNSPATFAVHAEKSCVRLFQCHLHCQCHGIPRRWVCMLIIRKCMPLKWRSQTVTALFHHLESTPVAGLDMGASLDILILSCAEDLLNGAWWEFRVIFLTLSAEILICHLLWTA